MRYFALLNWQHVILYVFPTLVFILLFATALGFAHLKAADSEARKRHITYRFPDGIEDRDAPFPLAMALIVTGALVWAVFYILMMGILGVKI
ncbi:MAG: hypothetical protein JEZ11_11330 [Desulfobacterales bacterium]|nr:hypothetical protein [Desulfobacterales bacterium]